METGDSKTGIEKEMNKKPSQAQTVVKLRIKKDGKNKRENLILVLALLCGLTAMDDDSVIDRKAYRI